MFKVGDKLIAIETKGALIKGREYIVTGSGLLVETITIKDAKTNKNLGGYYPRRFKKITKMIKKVV